MFGIKIEDMNKKEFDILDHDSIYDYVHSDNLSLDKDMEVLKSMLFLSNLNGVIKFKDIMTVGDNDAWNTPRMYENIGIVKDMLVAFDNKQDSIDGLPFISKYNFINNNEYRDDMDGTMSVDRKNFIPRELLNKDMAYVLAVVYNTVGITYLFKLLNYTNIFEKPNNDLEANSGGNVLAKASL